MKGSIAQRSPGTWSIRLEMPSESPGVRKQKRVTFRGTKREAERELTRLLHEVNTGGYVDPARVTVAEYLEKWLESYAKSSVSAKTYEAYAYLVNSHLSPALGRHTLARLQPLHIQRHYTEALESGRKDGQGGLSPTSVVHQHRVLRLALQQAVKWGLLVRNPADAVEPPHAQRRERSTLDRDGVRRLLEAAEGTRLHLPIILAAFCGLRRGEVLGLRWTDCDLEAGCLSVRQAAEQTKAKGIAFKAPKTAKSRRTVALPALVVRALQAHRARQAEQRLLFGPAYQQLGLVVAAEDGSPFTPNRLSIAFRSLVARAGVAAVTFHDLRHSHATLLLQANVHPKIVSERLGHSTIGLTMDTYSHVIPGMQEDAARKIDAAFGTDCG